VRNTDSAIGSRVDELRAFFGSAEMVDQYDATRDFRPGEAHMMTTYLRCRGNLLDVGCGTGRLSFLLADRCAPVDAFDIVPEVIASAKRRLAHEGGPLRFFVADATNIPAPSGVYDNVIFGYNGIEGIPTPALREKALREIHRVLRRGGRFVFSTKSCFTREWVIEFGVKRRIKALLAAVGAMEGDGTSALRGDIVHREHGRTVRLHTSNPFSVRRQLRKIGFKVLAFNSESRIERGKPEPTFWSNFDSWDHFYACEKVG
jgi:SAM-dependent methyltransferase